MPFVSQPGTCPYAFAINSKSLMPFLICSFLPTRVRQTFRQARKILQETKTPNSKSKICDQAKSHRGRRDSTFSLFLMKESTSYQDNGHAGEIVIMGSGRQSKPRRVVVGSGKNAGSVQTNHFTSPSSQNENGHSRHHIRGRDNGRNVRSSSLYFASARREHATPSLYISLQRSEALFLSMMMMVPCRPRPV